MSREFIGTYACMACGCKVRVYDWLPLMILCAACARREHENEDRTRGSDE